MSNSDHAVSAGDRGVNCAYSSKENPSSFCFSFAKNPGQWGGSHQFGIDSCWTRLLAVRQMQAVHDFINSEKRKPYRPRM
jgi:hypothetical protein